MTGDRRRRSARWLLLGPRTLLTGGLAIAAACGFFLTAALIGEGSPRGVVVQARPSLVSYQQRGNPNPNPNSNASGEGHFTIAGNASQVLYPGTTSTIDLAFTNTTGTAITLPAGAISIAIASQRTACPSSPNFSVIQTLTKAITIPPHVTGDSLADMAITSKDWPSISMVTTHVTQDACAGMTLNLHYSATVVSTGTVTAGTTGTGTGSGSPRGGTSSSGSSGSSTPVRSATEATASGPLAFTGLEVLLFVGVGALLLLLGIGLLTWRRRLGARR